MGSDGHKTAYRDNSILRNYVAKNYESWGKLAEKKGLLMDGPFDGPIFIYGFIKTTHWEIAVWSEAGESVEVRVGVEAAKYGTSEFSYSHEGSISPGISHHWGPPCRAPNKIVSQEPHPLPERDQCVFLSYYRVKHRRFLPSRIEASMGPHHLPNADHSPKIYPQLMVSMI